MILLKNFPLATVATLFSSVLASAVLLRKRRPIASWCFFAGMVALAGDTIFGGISLNAGSPERVAHWQGIALIAKSFSPAIWLCFSLTYSRGSYSGVLRRWRILLATAFLLPIGLAIGFREDLIHAIPPAKLGDGWWLGFGTAAKVLNVMLLLAFTVIMMNLEKTFRAAVGTTRWRVKFTVIGLAVVFGTRIYTRSQALLYSGHDLSLTSIEAAALVLGCMLVAIAYWRNGFGEIDIYPSSAVLQSSITALMVGAYLFIVGVLAQAIAALGGAENFQAHAFLVLLGVVALAILLFSERIRQKVRHLVSRHFSRPQYDFRKVWTLFAQRMSKVLDQTGLCAVGADLISETFDILSVTIWLVDDHASQLVFISSTFQSQREIRDVNLSGGALDTMRTSMRKLAGPFNLETVSEAWGESLRQVSPTQFLKGGDRFCLPLIAADRCLGAVVLADRVNGVRYTLEELDLLKGIGEQLAAGILNLQLTQDLMRSKELEAFQTMSTFFVHDLKNAASTLSLMLQNLPVHFDDPDFRADALRGIGSTVTRVNQLISRLTVLRRKLELKPLECDLNQLITETLQGLSGTRGVEFVKELSPLPKVFADREQIQSVLTNLLLNASEASETKCGIKVQTSQRNGHAVLTVTDNGCGMSPAFVRDSLFRPFQTTKKKGLGIGMFQSKMIVEAHRGSIQVESELDKGTTFRITLPITPHT